MTSLPVYISDPVGKRYRSAADHAFVTENMHRSIFDRLNRAGIVGYKHDIADQDFKTGANLDGYGGVIMLGGWDIDPIYYQSEYDLSRYISGFGDIDAFELDLLYDAYQRDLPVLGICRGMQMLNVFYGGTLYADIGHISGVRHNNFGAAAYGRRATVHKVFVHDSDAIPDGAYDVASSHHQAVDELGKGLRITGYGEDGIVEMIEHPTKRMVGVQWHPESAHVAQNDTISPLITNFAEQVHGVRHLSALHS